MAPLISICAADMFEYNSYFFVAFAVCTYMHTDIWDRFDGDLFHAAA
jgi:hypothetical protein